MDLILSFSFFMLYWRRFLSPSPVLPLVLWISSLTSATTPFPNIFRNLSLVVIFLFSSFLLLWLLSINFKHTQVSSILTKILLPLRPLLDFSTYQIALIIYSFLISPPHHHHLDSVISFTCFLSYFSRYSSQSSLQILQCL